MTSTTRAFWIDAAERLIWSFIEGATSIIGAAGLGWIELGSGEIWKTAAAGGISAALSLLKSMAASRLSGGSTAQLGANTYSHIPVTEADPA